MTNFIFKSAKGGLVKKLASQLEVVLNEQRHQRQDLAAILYLLKQLRNDLRLSSEVAEYHEDHDVSLEQETDQDSS